MAERTVYTIPAGQPFAHSLAARLLEETDSDPVKLSQIQIYLPTRRACRVLQEAFLQISKGRALMLPALRSFGDIDEEELNLNALAKGFDDALLEIPPAISPLKRQILLARTIQKIEGFTQSFDQSMELARALGHFMDQIYTESLKMSALETLVPESFSMHWQITIDFLKILSEYWPAVLKENGAIDPADRRDRLIRLLTKFWQTHPPQTRIIAAGSTGSIPATADFLKTIAELPQGALILPGLDQSLDEESWQALSETHPQFGLKHLLDHIGMPREKVQIWPEKKPDTHAAQIKNRAFLTTELMRPAQTIHHWQSLSDQASAEKVQQACKNLHLINCSDENEEALTIATLFRQTLETPEETIALITPDRNLAARVSEICKRWDLKIDDSAGRPLTQTTLGIFLIEIIEASQNEYDPIAFLSLLKNQYCRPHIENIDRMQALIELEKKGMRAIDPIFSYDQVNARLIPDHQSPDQHHEKTPAQKLLGYVRYNIDDLRALGPAAPFHKILKAHLEIAETLSADLPHGLYHGEEGEAMVKLLSDTLDHAHHIGDVSLQSYQNIFQTILSGTTLRPRYGTHPRLHIYGQLEARLIQADTLILAGLNEQSWPADPAHDPWMSRPMRADFGLPSPERSVGLAAHDFVQGLCAPKVYLTRAQTKDGIPAVPSRWLQRMSAVFEAAKIDLTLCENNAVHNWVKYLDEAQTVNPCTRPSPRPPIEKRPSSLYVTKIESWLRDPYSIYARYILKLRPLDPLLPKEDASRKGRMIHKIMERFTEKISSHLPANPQQEFLTISEEEIENYYNDPAAKNFLWPRIESLCNWVIDFETERSTVHSIFAAEIEGETEIATETKPFTLKAIADRIDVSAESYHIMDYKTGGSYSKAAIGTGQLPQLPLEALILEKGGFHKEKQSTQEPSQMLITTSLHYIKLTGGNPPGQLITYDKDLPELIKTTEANLVQLIETYSNENTPYHSIPRPNFIPAYNDYEHLARIREWSVIDQTADGEAS